MALRVRPSGPLSTSSRMASNFERCVRMISVTSASRMLTRGSPRLSPKISAIGPRAQATTAGTSSATTICALLPSTRQRGTQRKAHAEAADEHMRFCDLLDLLRRKRRERGLRAREAAVHQLVGAEHDGELLAAAHQAEFIVGAGNAGGVEFFPGNHAKACSMIARRALERSSGWAQAIACPPLHADSLAEMVGTLRFAARLRRSTRPPRRRARNGSWCRDRRSSAGRPQRRRRTFRDRSQPARP